jgi:hypothetical protein
MSRNAKSLAKVALLLAMGVSCDHLRAASSPDGATAPAPSSVTSDKAKQEAEKAYLAGARAIENDDLETAHASFSEATRLDPKNPDYSAAEQLLRGDLVTQLIQQADKAETLNHPDEARSKLLEAATLAPDNPSVLQHLDPHSNALSPRTGGDDSGEVSLEPVVVLSPEAKLQSFHIRGTGQELLKQVLSAYGISPSIDSSVEVKHTSFDGDDLSYAQAAHLLQLATHTFFVPLDPKRVLVAKDTKDNRSRFERQVVETVYLPGLSSTELTDMSNIARTLFNAQQASVQPGNNTLTVRAPQTHLTALNHTLASLLDGRSQVDIEVRLIEIDTSRSTNVGVQPPQQFTAFNAESELQNIINNNQSLVQQVVANGLAPAGDLGAIVAILLAAGEVTDPLLSGSFATFGNGLTLTGLEVPSVTANLALNSSKTRMLEDVHLRLQDQAEGDVKVGEKYPIETSSYSGLATSNVNIPGVSTAGLSSELAALGLGGAAGSQATIPQVTPHVLRSDNVDMTFDLKLQALAGSSLNDIPELTNREFSAIANAKAGRSVIFLSDLSKQEAVAVSGIPGISDLPGFQGATDETKTRQTTSLLIIITPEIVRHDHTELAGPAILLPAHD